MIYAIIFKCNLTAPPELFSDLLASTLFILERLPVLCTPSIRLAKLIDRIQQTYESRNLQIPVCRSSWLDYHSLEYIDNAMLKRALEMWSLPVTLTQDPSLVTRHTETCFQLWYT